VPRPRFILTLCAAAAIAVTWRLVEALAFGNPVREPFGMTLVGGPALAFTTCEAVALTLGSVGLWRRRLWARTATMAYLAAVIVSFLFFGVASSDQSRAVWTLAWQVSMVPFATFCFMFLYNGRRYFVVEPPGPQADRRRPLGAQRP
jgi:hypothetical protein